MSHSQLFLSLKQFALIAESRMNPALDTHYIISSYHPPRHHNTTTFPVHPHITDNYQHAQVTSPTATSSHVYCTKTVTELLLSQLTIYSNFTRLILIVTAVRFVIVDFKEMNE